MLHTFQCFFPNIPLREKRIKKKKQHRQPIHQVTLLQGFVAKVK